MARPPSITDEEVLAAARAVFLSKGISATVDEVAARCGVGEATIFRRFPTKQALFLAAMEMGETEWGRFLMDRAASAARGESPDTRAMLHTLARDMLDAGRKMMPLIMMKLSNPNMIDRGRASTRALGFIRILTDFFEVQVREGRISIEDPRIAARIWLGAIRHMVMFEEADDLPTEVFVEGLVDTFCKVQPRMPEEMILSVLLRSQCSEIGRSRPPREAGRAHGRSRRGPRVWLGILVLTALLTVAPARAERVVSLDQALAIARSNNRDLKIARARLAQSATNIELAWAALLPSARRAREVHAQLQERRARSVEYQPGQHRAR